MARRRFQRGSVFLRGKRDPVWVGRWREDVIGANGRIKRISRKEVLGTKKDFPTKKLALRELAAKLVPVNSTSYRPLRAATFAEFVKIWQENALTQHKPSTQAVIRSQIKTWLVPHLGEMTLKDIGGQTLQMFVNNCDVAPKTCRNFVLSLRMMWKSAKAWSYVEHNPFEGLVLPKVHHQRRFFFTLEEVQQILTAASEPHKTFYWLAAETGMRAGELCGLRIEDLDLENCIVNVRQSVWRNQVQSPKTVNAIRQFSISPKLAGHLRAFLTTWRPNMLNLVFASPKGKPWAPCNLMRSKLHPLLDSLKIKRCGLHAFRHTNSSLMDSLNAPMKVRQERLGHAPGSEITLAVYTHTIGRDDRELATKLGEILCPNVPKLGTQQELASVEVTTVQ